MCYARLSASTNTYANANDDSLISVGDFFSPPPSPMPTDFTDKSDGDERFLESECSNLFELTVAAGMLLVKDTHRFILVMELMHPN